VADLIVLGFDDEDTAEAELVRALAGHVEQSPTRTASATGAS
jgi:hypothetical protein